MIKASIPTCDGNTTYWESNAERPDALILLHGFRGNHRQLMPMSQYFHRYRIILPDRPGYGESDRLNKGHTGLNYSYWLDDFIGRLGLTNFVVWGHSYGATLALIHGARGSRKPLAIVAVSAPLPGQAILWPGTVYYQLGCIMPAAWRRMWLVNRSVDKATGRLLLKKTGGKERRALLAETLQNLTCIQPDVVSEEYFSSIHADLFTYVEAISVPILFMTGAKDILAPLNRVRSLAFNAQQGSLYIMPDLGHLAPIEAAKETAIVTERFLDRIVGR